MKFSPPPLPDRSKPYGLNQQLAVEAHHKSLVELLFLRHRVSDISERASERKSGTDFLLHLTNDDGSFSDAIRCENKFEQYWFGRLTLEGISVDRPNFAPGWVFTSRAAWLLSWFPTSELVVMPMADARKLVLADPARNVTTTAENPGYLTWSSLESIDYVLRTVENARLIDLEWELGLAPRKPRMVKGTALEKRCRIDELTALMRTLPASSTPVAVSDDYLVEMARTMAPKNLKREQHRPRLDELAWLKNSRT